MATLERAIAIAAEAHAGQVDKGGAPYIFHPLRVMLAMATEEERIVAVLHDVVEDCPKWSLSRLVEERFGPSVVSALDALTRRKGETYDAFIERLSAKPLARRVKLADLADNSDLSRIASPTEVDLARLEKYRRATRVLAL
jgi:(p)ppGpp synthase/HD superfamily hydrolase